MPVRGPRGNGYGPAPEHGDDLKPQPTWPDDHQSRVDRFVRELHRHDRMRWTLMDWASGLVVAARLGDPPYLA
ncbi:hypothetical protein [Streptomyces sp. NPDC093071]|uniref:hypothetical protein n=1 Tax=Streptomyces sp. NPDC093071 TaxID=3366022 RepID=UPI0038075502